VSTPPTAAKADGAVIPLLRDKAARDAADRAYARVVEQARHPRFFTDCGVPDTLDGRFELICLHAFLYLHRLKDARPRAEVLGQRFFDTMFDDMDRSLREMGTGDLGVGRQVKRMAQAFYGRIQAYENGIEKEDALLTPALARNLFGTVSESEPFLDAMATYVRDEVVRLRHQPISALLAGDVAFGPPPIGQRRPVSPAASALLKGGA